jgi:hypothetical protein
MIYSIFPADNAAGKYDTILPSVVFTKKTFPWSRHPGKTMQQPIGPGKDTDDDVPTWLTILLLDEDDLQQYTAAYPDFTLKTKAAVIGDLFLKSANPNSTLGSNYAYFNHITKPESIAGVLDPGDQLTDAIEVLDIPLALFWKIAPTMEDLKWMAHVRKVSLLNKPTMPGISDKGTPEGSFSIVFGNRLPGSMKKTNAFLVSLEQMEAFLPTDDGTPRPGTALDAKKTLRLAVLKSWSFASTGDSAAFVEQLRRLNGAAATDPGKAANADHAVNTNLRLTVSDQALPLVKNALSMGYVPLNHELRTAEHKNGAIALNKTVSWYRGPCLPYLTQRPAIRLPVSSPDKATIFDPTTGMLDTSYAAAWTLGRQLALQDKSFSTALYQWKRGVTQNMLHHVENEILSNHLGAALSGMQSPEATAAATTNRRSALAAPTDETALPKQKPRPGDLLRKAILLAKARE